MEPTEILDAIEELEPVDFEYVMTQLTEVAKDRGFRMSFRP